MKMFRRLIGALALVLILGAGCALAENPEPQHPIDPYAAEFNAAINSLNRFRLFALRRNYTVTVEEAGTYLEETTTWTASVEEEGEYTFAFTLARITDEGEYDGIGFQSASANNAFSFRVMVPGDYILLVNVTGESGVMEQTRHYFTVENDDYPTLDELVENVVNQCRASGVSDDYETALWLHEWLLDNCTYDFGYVHHSPEAAFILGTGVCDTYSKAYRLLLKKAGIEAVRVTGGGHAWNAAKLEGDWYQIDPTWDDQTKLYPSGRKREIVCHFYFCLPDELMQLDHTYESESPSCTSYDAHYFLRKNVVEQWMYDVEPFKDEVEKGVYTLIEEALAKGVYTFSLDMPTTYLVDWAYDEYSSSNTHCNRIVYAMTAYALNKSASWSYGDERVDLTISYLIDANGIAAQVDFGDKVFVLPDGLTEVDAEAFEGANSVMAVELPDGALSIAERAFAGCAGLWKVAIPDSVQYIEDGAFDGCPHISIACSENSYAREYAINNDIHYVIE